MSGNVAQSGRALLRSGGCCEVRCSPLLGDSPILGLKMPSLMIRLSITDILLVEKLIDNYMKENNIKNIDDIDEKVIQQTYDEMMKKQMWTDPQRYLEEK